MKNSIIINFLYFIVLYIYMFNPPLSFLPLSPKFILMVVLIPVFFKQAFYKLFSECKFFFTLLSIILLFSFFREIGSDEFVFTRNNLLTLIECVLLPLQIIYLSEYFKRENLLIDIIKVSGIAAMISLVMILVPSLSEFIRYSLLRTDDFTEAVSHRTFGLAESLTFSYGLIQGFMVSLVLFLGKRDKKLLFLIPLFILSVLFNARIGMAGVLLGSGAYFVFNFKFKQVLLLGFCCLGGYLLIFNTSLFVKQKETIEWGLDFFNQVGDLTSGKASSSDSTFDTLFGEMLVFPDGEIGILVGTGEYIFGKSFGHNSDVGYIIQMYFGGIVYLFMLLLIPIKMYLGSRNFGKETFVVIGVSLVILLIGNIKGNLFQPIGYLRLVFLLFFYCYLQHRKQIKFID